MLYLSNNSSTISESSFFVSFVMHLSFSCHFSAYPFKPSLIMLLGENMIKKIIKINLLIFGMLFLGLIMLGCTSNQTPQNSAANIVNTQSDTSTILAPTKSLCPDAFKGSLDYDQTLVAGKYVITLNTISFGSPNKALITIKDVLSGTEQKQTLDEGTSADILFGTSKLTVLFSGMDYAGGTKAKFEVCYDKPKACNNPAASALIDYGDSLNVAGLYLIKINTINFGSPSTIQLDVFDAKSGLRIATDTFVEGIPQDFNVAGRTLTLTASLDYSSGTKVKVSVCGDIPNPPAPKCNPSVDTLSVVTLAQNEKIMWNSRFELEVQGILGTDQAIVKITDKTTSVSRVYTLDKGVLRDTNLGGITGISLLLEHVDLRIGNKPSEMAATITICDKVSDFQGALIN